ncbi:MAG TPA: SRPBCC family protein [Chloroflexota bacterium]|nr:SRPBCC family protein [Chloroflexota bacterium]
MPSRVVVALRVEASPERAFQAFTDEIGAWWQPNGLFRFTARGPGRLAFEPGAEGRLVETQPDGTVFEIGRVIAWDPPARLAFQWRQEGFGPDQQTEVQVRFEPVGSETRVVVEHVGWGTIPQDHVARHGFPLEATQLRLAEWWQALLRRYQAVAGAR